MSRTRLRRITLAIVVATVSGSVAWAADGNEDLDALTVGSRVRLAAPAALAGRVQGLVLTMDDDALLVGTDHGPPVRVPREAITRLEVSTGRRGRALKGAAIGGAIGGVVFAGIPREEYCVDYVGRGETCPSRAEMVGTGVVGGALWGLLIGHLVKTDRWSSVPLSGTRVSVAPARARGGWGLSLSVGW